MYEVIAIHLWNPIQACKRLRLRESTTFTSDPAAIHIFSIKPRPNPFRLCKQCPVPTIQTVSFPDQPATLDRCYFRGSLP